MNSATDASTIRYYDLEGGINFRDIGGYPTEDGRRVRYGHFFRSGKMNRLTEQDIETLKSLSIRGVCDLRAPHERETHPSHWLAEEDIHVHVRHDQETVGDLAKFYTSIQNAPHIAAEVMKGGYRTMPYTLAPSYRAMFGQILSGRVPLIFHCAAGKDRTGIAAGLLLTALGVPRETILEDYRATDRITERLYELMREQTDGVVELKTDREIWRPLLSCDPSYLEASFTEMEQRDGSVEAYLQTHAGVDCSGIETLRALYTE